MNCVPLHAQYIAYFYLFLPSQPLNEHIPFILIRPYVPCIHTLPNSILISHRVPGPSLLIKLRGLSEVAAIDDLLTKISPEKFQAAFGAPMEQASQLLATKTLSISKLMVLAPPGTLDPTPHLYDTTMYTLAGLMATAVVAHALVQPMKQIVLTPTKPATVEILETVVGDRQVNK